MATEETGPTDQPPDISFEKLSIHHRNLQGLSICQKLANINTVAIEQNNDVILQQLKLKIQKEKNTLEQSSYKILDTNTTYVNWTACPFKTKSSPDITMTKQEM